MHTGYRLGDEGFHPTQEALLQDTKHYRFCRFHFCRFHTLVIEGRIIQRKRRYRAHKMEKTNNATEREQGPLARYDAISGSGRSINVWALRGRSPPAGMLLVAGEHARGCAQIVESDGLAV